MGLYDRDYYRDIESSGSLGLRSRSVVTALIAMNAAVWVVEVILKDYPGYFKNLLACSPAGVFEHGQVWQLLTANFVHDEMSIFHILNNMLFLYLFGRDLEAIYGKRDFLIFYLLAGMFAMFAQAGIGYLRRENSLVFGASGSVSGVVVLFTFFFPQREIFIFGLFAVPAWLLCLLFLLINLSGAVGMNSAPIAYWAHLGGAAMGALYRFVDLRWNTVASRYLRGASRYLEGLFQRNRRSRISRPPGGRRPGKIIPFPEAQRRSGREAPERDAISERIDQLLEKISREGKESLTPEELEFLKANSQFYRSH